MGSGNSVLGELTTVGEGAEVKTAMLKETPLGRVLSETDLAYFSTFFTIQTMAPHCNVAMGAGELLVVGEGEVQVYVIESGLDDKTGEQKFQLCKKRKGDLIWVPSVTRITSRTPSKDLSELEVQVGQIEAEEKEVDEQPRSKHKDLYNLIDTTFIDSLYGATLLKLDRKKYETLTQTASQQDLDMVAIRRVIECNMEDYLRKVALFKQIPLPKLAVLGQMCNYEFVKAGQKVCNEGEAGREIYIVLDGRLAVQATKNQGDMVTLAVLGPGDYFGELGTLVRIKRIATVVSSEDSLLACIKRHDFRSFMTIMPEVRLSLEREIAKVLLTKYSKTGNRFFSSSSASRTQPVPSSGDQESTISPQEAQTNLPASASVNNLTSIDVEDENNSNKGLTASAKISDLCDVEDVDAGRVIFYENDHPSCMYYLCEGQVRLQRRTDKTDEDTIVLGAGSLIGVRSLLLNVPQKYTVVTDQICVFLKLSRNAFHQHLQACPDVKATLEVKRHGSRVPLVTLLECPEAREAFQAHLAGEFALEHLSYYDDVAALDVLLSKGDLELADEAARNIHDSYLCQSAHSPINIPDTTRQRILAEFETKRLFALNSLVQKSTLLNEARKEVLTLMEKDNFSRFKLSAAFELLLKDLNVKLPSEPFEQETD